jgi:hypothetical protein
MRGERRLLAVLGTQFKADREPIPAHHFNDDRRHSDRDQYGGDQLGWDASSEGDLAVLRCSGHPLLPLPGRATHRARRCRWEPDSQAPVELRGIELDGQGPLGEVDEEAIPLPPSRRRPP